MPRKKASRAHVRKKNSRTKQTRENERSQSIIITAVGLIAGVYLLSFQASALNKPQLLASLLVGCQTAEAPDAFQKPNSGAISTNQSKLTRSHNLFLSTHDKYRSSQGALTRAALSLEVIEQASSRKQDLVNLMNDDPDRALSFVLSSDRRSDLPAAAKNCVEQEASVTGTLEAVATDFTDGSARTTYELATKDGKRVRMHLANKSLGLISGLRVTAKGYRLDDELLVDGGVGENFNVVGGSEATPTLAAADAKGLQKVLVILAHFSNTPQPTFAKGEAAALINTQVNSFYQENSYGITSFSAPATVGWYRLPIKENCDFKKIYNAALNAANSSVNFNNYRGVLIVIPETALCSWLGQSTIGKKPISQDGATISIAMIHAPDHKILWKVAHELGHSLGVGHANFFDCGNAAWKSTGCRTVYYGDKSDIMSKDVTVLMNGPHKFLLGYLSGSQVRIVYQNGDYMLNQLEGKSTNVKLLGIQTSSGRGIYVEYRNLVGTDFNLNPAYAIGALVHLDAGETLILDSPPLFDRLPDGSPFDPAIVAGGQPIIVEGIKISAVSKTDTTITIRVQFPKSGYQNPQCSDGADNDNDGKTDYPDDPGCSDANDDDETNSSTSPCQYTCHDPKLGSCELNGGVPKPGTCSGGKICCDFGPTPQCSDGADNDNDGKTDYPDDPGCSDPNDDSESPDPPPPCTDDCNTNQCWDSLHTRPCRTDFDSDPCYDWGPTVFDCPAGTSCPTTCNTQQCGGTNTSCAPDSFCQGEGGISVIGKCDSGQICCKWP